MALEKPSVNKASEESRRAMERASAYALPNNPSDRGMTPDELKRAFWQPFIGTAKSILYEQDRIVEELNRYLDAFYVAIGGGDAVIPSEEYEQFLEDGESGLTGLANAAWRLLLYHILQNVNVDHAPDQDPHGAYAAIENKISLHNSYSQAHDDIRKKIYDDIFSHNQSADSHPHLLNKIRISDANISTLFSEVAEINSTLGADSLTTEQKTVKAAINETYFYARNADDLSKNNKINLVSIAAQILGISKNYVLNDFQEFLRFMRGEISVNLLEDRDGDGINETYQIFAKDLHTGDNILIVEKDVADFWFEASYSTDRAETYDYNGGTYDLIAYNGLDQMVGLMHLSETDYNVIAGYATSAGVSANDAKNYAQRALASASDAESHLNDTKTLVNSIFFLQKAPKLQYLNDAIMISTPTLAMLPD